MKYKKPTDEQDKGLRLDKNGIYWQEYGYPIAGIDGNGKFFDKALGLEWQRPSHRIFEIARNIVKKDHPEKFKGIKPLPTIRWFGVGPSN